MFLPAHKSCPWLHNAGRTSSSSALAEAVCLSCRAAAKSEEEEGSHDRCTRGRVSRTCFSFGPNVMDQENLGASKVARKGLGSMGGGGVPQKHRA